MNPTTGQLSQMGKLILSLEIPPWDILYRTAIGYLIMPMAAAFYGPSFTSPQLLLVLVGVLAALRIVPGVLRRALPFPREMKGVWAERRALAKRYDSYQWRKLLGIGLGWLVYLTLRHQTSGVPLLMAAACLLAGMLGLACWFRINRLLAAQTSSPVVG